LSSSLDVTQGAQTRETAREGFIDRLAAGHAQTIVTYGTSLTAGGAWPGLLQELLNRKYPGLATVINSGEGGQWSGWGVENLDERVLQKHPDAVFLEFGVNDAVLRFNASLELARSNLELMLDRILGQNPLCQVILQTMNCAGGAAEERRGGRTAAYYQIYRDVARERGLLLIDMYPVWKNLFERDFVEFQRLAPDLLHPNREGAERIAMPVIEAVLWPQTSTTHGAGCAGR